MLGHSESILGSISLFWTHSISFSHFNQEWIWTWQLFASHGFLLPWRLARNLVGVRGDLHLQLCRQAFDWLDYSIQTVRLAVRCYSGLSVLFSACSLCTTSYWRRYGRRCDDEVSYGRNIVSRRALDVNACNMHVQRDSNRTSQTLPLDQEADPRIIWLATTVTLRSRETDTVRLRGVDQDERCSSWSNRCQGCPTAQFRCFNDVLFTSHSSRLAIDLAGGRFVANFNEFPRCNWFWMASYDCI